MPILRGSRVVLNAILLDDAERIVEACSTEDAARFLDTPLPYSLDDALGYITQSVADGWLGKRAEHTWAIREHEDGPLLGVVSLRGDLRETGFWLHPSAHGHGFMSDALRTLLGAKEGAHNWGELQWRCVDGNIASMRVAEAVGFAYLGSRPGTHRGQPITEHYAVRLAVGWPEEALPWPTSN